MSSSVLISSLDFTKSVGKRDSAQNVPFSDIIEIGGFPFENKIKSIQKLEIYSDTKSVDKAVIVGLKITYKLTDGTTIPVSRGLVNETQVGEFTINPDQLLVGVYGQLKHTPNDPSDKRVTSISFVLFNKASATVETKGPYRGSEIGLGSVWASFGNTISFEGTRSDAPGLLSLGFVKQEADGGFSVSN